MGVAMKDCVAVLAAAGVPDAYVATVGQPTNSHLDVHLLPRWPETPAEVAWHSVDDWPAARTADAAAIADFVASLRSIDRDLDS
jgi:diadenosine tetraphosphate (Ap4A) HIT family hydrolase